MAYEEMPYCIKLNFVNMEKYEFVKELNKKIKESPNKLFINTLSDYFPKSFINIVFNSNNIYSKKKQL